MDYVSMGLLAIGAIVMAAALIMIVGFAISMPIGVVVAAKDHHEHQPPHEKHSHKHHQPSLGH